MSRMPYGSEPSGQPATSPEVAIGASSSRSFVIYFLRSATIAQGKLVLARQFASEIADYIKAKTGTSVTVGMPIGGHVNRIGWFVSYKSLAELDEIQTKLLQDSEYLALTTKGADNFIAGSVHDEIWRIF
jgi:hypothetical protein